MAAAEGASQEPYESVFARSVGRQQLDRSVASMLPPSAWITEATLRRLCLERLGAQGVGPDGVGSDDSPPCWCRSFCSVSFEVKSLGPGKAATTVLFTRGEVRREHALHFELVCSLKMQEI